MNRPHKTSPPPALTRTRRTEVSMELNAEQLKTLLALPPSAVLSFRVPTGGDYSGMVLEVGDQTPLEIRWTETEEENPDG